MGKRAADFVAFDCTCQAKAAHGHVVHRLQEVSKTASKGAENGSQCPGNERCEVISLAKLSTGALQLFADLAVIASHYAESQGNSTDLSIEQQHERLALWASNLGATHLGHSSLDYRLREADLVRNAIGTFLKDLCESLLECEVYRRNLGVAPDICNRQRVTHLWRSERHGRRSSVGSE